jgi:glycerophosphoryl diester phosphodiesterase
VASFSERRLAYVRRELGPRLCTSLGPRGVLRLRAAASSPATARLAPRGIPCAQVPDRLGRLRVVTPALVELAHARGQRLHVWTVDDAADMHRLLDLGADGIMTDRIDTLRDVMVARGHWTR